MVSGVMGVGEADAGRESEGSAPDAVTVSATVAGRLGAGAVDGLLLGGGLVLVLGLGASAGGWEGWGTAAWIFGFVPLYFALYHAFDKGATPGQLELRIALADDRRPGPPSLARALGRSVLGLAFLVLVLPAAADLLMLLTTGRSLRDRLTRTGVVHLRLAGALPELRQPTVPELRTVFEPAPDERRYLRRSWALVRTRPHTVIKATAAVFAVLLVIAIVFGFLVVADAPGDFGAVVYYASITLLLLASAVYWAQAAVVLAVEQVRTGAGRASAMAALVRASRRLNALSAALALLLVAAIAGAYLVYLVLPALLAVRLTLVVPALVLEDRRVLGSFQRSWELTGGAAWRILGLVLLSGTILATMALLQFLVIGAIATATADGPGGGAVVGLLVVIAVVVSVPFVLVLAWLGTAWALVYEDARRRLPPREEV